MSKLNSIILAGEEGGAQGTVEYVTVLGLVVVIVLAAMNGMFNDIAAQIQNVHQSIQNQFSTGVASGTNYAKGV